MKSFKVFSKYKKSLFAVLMAVVLTIAVPFKAQAITINGLAYVSGGTTRYKMGNITSAFNVRGKINGSNSYNFQTTYEYNNVGGYTVDFEVDGDNLALEVITNGQTVTNNGVQLTLVSETTENGLDVNFNIVNPEGNGEHSYRVAMTADVQLGSNDYAAIYKKDHSGLVVTQDDETKVNDYGAKIYIDYHPNADTVWLGDYTERIANKYTDGGASTYTFADKVDTAAAWSWGGEMADGESKVITTSFNLVEAETTNVQFYDINNELVDEKEVLVGGAVTLPTLSDPEPGQLHVWCENADGTGNCYNGDDTIVVTEEGLTLHEAYIDDPAYQVQVVLYDINNTEVMNETVKIGDEVTLPTLSDPEPGELHVWCENADGTGNCYNGNDTIVVTEEGLTLHEAYIDDPAYVEPTVEPTIKPDPNVGPADGEYTDSPAVAPVIATVTYSNSYVDNYTPTDTSDSNEQNELPVPQVSEKTDVLDNSLEKTEPLGVNIESNINSGSIWGILEQIWPYIIALLFSFFIFFILLFKRRKDEEEDEEGVRK